MHCCCAYTAELTLNKTEQSLIWLSASPLYLTKWRGRESILLCRQVWIHQLIEVQVSEHQHLCETVYTSASVAMNLEPPHAQLMVYQTGSTDSGVLHLPELE